MVPVVAVDLRVDRGRRETSDAKIRCQVQICMSGYPPQDATFLKHAGMLRAWQRELGAYTLADYPAPKELLRHPRDHFRGVLLR